jgi:Flp pilus assembly pilin Flp
MAQARCGSSGLEPPTFSTLKEQLEMTKIKNFLKDETGLETLEYALIAGLVAAVAIIVYATGWGTQLSNRLLRATTTG